MHSNTWAAQAALVGVLGALALTPQLAAQGTGNADQDQPAGQTPASLGISIQDLNHGTWMDVDHLGVHAHGADYKSLFDQDGMHFIPALGSGAPTNQEFSLRATEISRGGRPWQLQPGVPKRVGEMVVYHHRDSAERFGIRPDGIEHSYVLDRLPQGEGDLVIRHRIETPLTASNRGANRGVRFELEGIGGVEVGGVTGIDANGERFTGSVSYAHGVLEYRLPADRVAGAELPLTVDPFLTVFNIEIFANDDGQCDVAYDATDDNYGICWQRVFSGADTEIRAGVWDQTGTPVVSFLAVTSNSVNDTQPRIANVNATNAFVVTWTELTSQVLPLDYNVKARGFNAAGSLGGVAITVAGGTGLQSAPDIAGDSTQIDDEAIVVYLDGNNSGDVWARQVNVNNAGDVINIGLAVNISNASSAFSDLQPAISESGGPVNRYHDRLESDWLRGQHQLGDPRCRGQPQPGHPRHLRRGLPQHPRL